MATDQARTEGVRADGVRVARIGDDEVVVKRGLAEVRMATAGIADLVDEILAMADGRSDAESLIAYLGPRHEHAERVVSALLARGILRLGGDDGAASRFWSSVVPAESDMPGRLASRTVRVSGSGELADGLRAALRHNGIGTVLPDAGAAAGSPVDVWCAATEGPADPELLVLSRRALAEDTVFLPVWIDDLLVRIGPLTFPYDTACLRCCLWRLDSTDPWHEVRRTLRRSRTSDTGDAGHLPSMLTLATAAAAGEVALYLAGLPVRVNGRVLELSTVPFAATARRVLKVPRCPDCSGSADRGSPVLMHGPQLVESTP